MLALVLLYKRFVVHVCGLADFKLDEKCSEDSYFGDVAADYDKNMY